MDESVESQKTWGICLSTTYDFSKENNPNYPEWAAKSDFHCQGPTKLIIWNEVEHKSAVLTAIESLNLMDRLLVAGDWQTIGVSITRKVLKFQIQISRKKKKNDKEKPDEDPAASEKSQWVDEILLRLPPQAGFELLELLQNNHNKLMALVEEEHQMQVKTLTRVYDQIFEWGRNAEEKEINFLSRIVAWTRLKEPNHWVCTSGENRGAIHPLGWRNWSASI
jgi:cobalamin-dependent methionine synthase I